MSAPNSSTKRRNEQTRLVSGVDIAQVIGVVAAMMLAVLRAPELLAIGFSLRL
jgi:hypothetical protein